MKWDHNHLPIWGFIRTLVFGVPESVKNFMIPMRRPKSYGAFSTFVATNPRSDRARARRRAAFGAPSCPMGTSLLLCVQVRDFGGEAPGDEFSCHHAGEGGFPNAAFLGHHPDNVGHICCSDLPNRYFFIMLARLPESRQACLRVFHKGALHASMLSAYRPRASCKSLGNACLDWRH